MLHARCAMGTLRFPFEGMQEAKPRSAKAWRSLVGIVTPVGQQRLGPGQRHQRRSFVVTHLFFAEQHDQWATLAIANREELGVQSAFGTPDTSDYSACADGLPYNRLLDEKLSWALSKSLRKGLRNIRLDRAAGG